MANEFKTGGRKQGTPNKINNDIKEVINEFISNNISDIQNVYSGLEPKEKMQYLIKLLDYSIPKLKAIEVENTSSINNNIINLGSGINSNVTSFITHLKQVLDNNDTKEAENLINTFVANKGVENLTDEQISNELKRLTIKPKDWI